MFFWPWFMQETTKKCECCSSRLNSYETVSYLENSWWSTNIKKLKTLILVQQ